MRRSPSLLSQVLAVNTLLIVATVLTASVAVHLDLGTSTGLRNFLVLVAAMLATVLANGFVLRRRFRPLEHLIDAASRAGLGEPGVRAPASSEETSDVARLREAFNRMLDRLETQRTESASAVLGAQEAERARLARDLHDEVNQALTAITLRLQATAQAAPAELRDELDETRRLAAQAMEELLRLARELRPTALDDHGLLPALRSQVESFGERHGMRTRFAADHDLPALDDDEQLVVYRVVQESLSNVAQHAGARGVTVTLDPDDRGKLRVRVRDDGRGFSGDPREGLGLKGMRERALQAGGRLRVVSVLGAGTTVELDL
jgi:two-component system, NarL family, sensor histidine kinase UhpB